MKILVVTQYYWPEQFQINEIAPELVRRGHEVTVLCGVPNYPKGVVFEGYETSEKRRVKAEEYYGSTGVRILYTDQIPRGKNPLQLVLNYWSFAHNGCKAVAQLDGGFDVVLGYQLSPVTSMYPAVEYKRLHGTPLVLYTLDIWPVSAESMLRSKRNPLYSVVRRISKKIYGAADRILVTSRPFIDYLHSENSVSLEKMGYLPQHAGTEMLDADLGADDNGITDFMFAGNLGKGQRIDVIVNAAKELGARRDYHIHIVGDGRMRSTLEKMVAEAGLSENFTFYGNQQRSDMPRFYEMADALLITLRGNNEVGNTMPGKLQMYMTTGKPIFGAINGAANEVIRESGCGNCTVAGDSKGLAGIMRSFIEQPDKYSECGINAREYFRHHFTLDTYIDGLEAELKEIAKNTHK